MAYKFQLGAAVLSGSVTQEGQVLAKDSALSGSSLSLAGTAATATAAELNVLASSGLAAADMSTLAGLALDGVAGLVTADFTKLAAIDASAAELNNLDGFADAAYDESADSVVFFDATDSKLKSEGAQDFATALAGDGLSAASGKIKVDVSEFAGTGLTDEGSENLAIDLNGLGAAALATADSIVFIDATDNSSKKETIADLVTLLAGDGIQNSSNKFAIDVDVMAGVGLTADNTNEELDVSAAQTGITSIYNAALIVGRGASDAHIDFGTDDQIQFDIDNTATMNLSANGINLQAGAIQIPAEADIDVAGAGAASIHASLGANNLTLGGSTSTVVIPGNLTVSGTTVEIDAAFVVTSSVQFEGTTPDGNEISLTSANPTADRTITLPDLDGHVPLLAGAISNANVTAAEFALLDGGTSRTTNIPADGDGFLHNNNGTMEMTTVDKMAEYVFSKVTGGDATIASNGNLTIAAGSVEHGMLADDIISGQAALGGATVAQADLLMLDDGPGEVKKVTFSNFEDSIFGNVSGDIAIAAGGAATIQANAVEGSMFNNNVISGQTQLSVSSASDIAAADELLISDAGTIKRVAMSGIKTFIGSGQAAVNAIGDTNAALAVGVNAPSTSASAQRTWTLPASAGLSAGDSIVIKAYGNSGTHPVTVAVNSGQEIDGVEANILLESDNAAVTLYYLAADTFIIV